MVLILDSGYHTVHFDSDHEFHTGCWNVSHCHLLSLLMTVMFVTNTCCSDQQILTNKNLHIELLAVTVFIKIILMYAFQYFLYCFYLSLLTQHHKPRLRKF